MKKHLFTLALILLSALALQAQTTQSSGAAAPVSPLLKGRDLLQQLGSALDAGSFLSSWTPWQQSHWFSGLTKITDATGLAKSAAELTEFIRPEKFKEGFSIEKLRAFAADATNYGDAANVMATLESGLTVEAYKNDWVGKEGSWQSELKLVK